IVFNTAGVFATEQTITLASGQLTLSNTSVAETITGPAAGVIVNAGGHSRGFQGDATVIASISRLTITRGTAANAGGLANYGYATLSNCTITGNSSTASSPDTGGAGLFSYGTIKLSNCTISSNTAAGAGGGLFEKLSTMTLSDCIISGNSADA